MKIFSKRINKLVYNSISKKKKNKSFVEQTGLSGSVRNRDQIIPSYDS